MSGYLNKTLEYAMIKSRNLSRGSVPASFNCEKALINWAMTVFKASLITASLEPKW
ncbi:MAG: hypothetical protein BWX93_01767 [Bacteroidetes bacterium ADurb.Bin139]|nr:MAG: hypothetical protein BWX93_01767 [Bacteroidetes bacterium ADurb.Bin139]